MAPNKPGHLQQNYSAISAPMLETLMSKVGTFEALSLDNFAAFLHPLLRIIRALARRWSFSALLTQPA